MIDWLYTLILLLSGLLLVVQELIIRARDKTLKAQHVALLKCKPILAAIVQAAKEAKVTGNPATIKLPKE